MWRLWAMLDLGIFLKWTLSFVHERFVGYTLSDRIGRDEEHFV